MKKLVLTTISVAFALLMFIGNAQAQKKYVNKAQIWAESGEKLDTALGAVKYAETQEKTADWAKTYYVKGLVYNAIAESENEEFKKLSDEPLIEAFNSFKKAYTMDGGKAYEGAMDVKFVTLSGAFIQNAVNAYNEQDYETAFKNFKTSLEVKKMPVFENEVDTAIIFNTAITAQRTEKYDEAIKYYKKAIELGYGEGDTYALLADCYKSKGDNETYLSTLKEGFERYPANQSLLGGIINYYLLEAENSEGAFKYIEVARQGDPDNPQFYSAEAHLYNKIGEYDKAIEKYKEAIELDPELFEAQYNLGVIFFNEGVELSDSANMITDNAKYEAAKKKADEKFAESLPYIEKAHELNPEDQMIMQTLKTLYYRLKMDEKYEEISAKME
ncbi:MAG: tetratricopeptide repeat protein [Bacteroidetes bacterium]|nr:tetratricopeptide repeat protein [Bacteroidota bacterium]